MVSFQRARAEHLGQIVDLLADDDLGKHRENDEIETYREAFEKVDEDRNQTLVVGLEESRVVAFLQLTFIPGLGLKGTRRAQIEAVRVAADRRNEGIGTALIDHAVGLARAQGCGVVQLTTNRRRQRALAFYERMGFTNSHNGMKLYLDPGLSPASTVRPALRVGSIVIRVDDLDRQAAFWEQALDYVRRVDDDEDFILLRPRNGIGPNVSLDRWAAPVQIPPKIHLDLYADDQEAEVDRLVALGATRVPWDNYPPDADFVILADPEGNRFCVIA
jgi:ribosomal protein S18 acetylase RimI-like enzyme/predicted enzyme related to lactoylglutathione lyase